MYPLTSYPQWLTACKAVIQNHNQDIHIDTVGCKTFPTPQAVLSFLPPRHPSLPLATSILFSISIIFSFQEGYVSGIIQYIAFWGWLSSLSIILWRLSRLLQVPVVHFLLLRSGSPCYGCTTIV